MAKSLRTYLFPLLGGVIVLSSARAQVVITLPTEGEVSAYSNQAVVGQAPANLPVRLDVNGVVVDSTTARIDGSFEFLGVRTPRGPVTYTVTARMRNGVSFKAQRSMHVLGPPDSILVSIPSRQIPADGKSVLNVVVRLVDRWGVRIPNGYAVTVHVDSLRIVEEDIDPNTPGHQLQLIEGNVSFGLLSTSYVGPVLLTLSSNGVVSKGRLYAVTPKVPFLVVGSADATGRNLRTTGETKGLAPSEEFSAGFHKQGRLAATARGTVMNDYLLTLSVDTDRKLQDRIFRDLDPNSLYSLYGDNSLVMFEAQSTSPVYAKLERNRSYLMYGDFHTGLTRTEFAAYNRSFTGGKFHVESPSYNVDLFGTVTNRKVVQEEIRGAGISGYYFLRQNNLVTGSEKVRIEVRDRFRSEIVISKKERARYSDYEIDYIQGTLYFKQPVPSLDELNNPVYIVVSYEAISNTPDSYVAGGAGEITFLNALTLGATAVVEERLPKNYTLLGGNAKLAFGNFGSLSGEAARSTDVNTMGNAWKVEAEIAPYRIFSLRPYYRKVDGTFVNATQSGSGREVGTTKYGGIFEVEPVNGTRLSGDFYQQWQSAGTLSTDIRSITGAVRQHLWKGSEISAKVEDVKYDGENPEIPAQNLRTHSTLLSTGLNVSITEPLRASAEYERNLRKSETRDVRPDAVSAGLEYQVSRSVSVYAKQKFFQGHGHLTTVGVNTNVAEQTTVYGRYEIGNAISGERNAATIGLKNSLKITDELIANVLYEKTKNLSRNLAEARTDDHDAFSLSLEYFPAFPLRATVKGEYSEDRNNLRRGFDYGVMYRLVNDLSVVAKGTYFLTESRLQTGFAEQSHYLFGVAYRPVKSNWLNLIGKTEIKTQSNQVVQPTSYYQAIIVSGHAFVEPLPRVAVGLKYALKDARDRYDATTVSTLTDFILVRPQYDLTRWMNVAGEARFLRQRGANDIKTGYSGEVGFVFIQNTMVSVGYNFQAYKDRDLVDYIYSVQGPYITFRLKFDENLFGLNGR